MGDIVLAGATSGTTTLTPTAVSGTTTLTLPATTGTVALTASPTFTGQATIPTINLTGGQITFPATAVPSADANTLDDYEEGTWTPVAASSAGSLTSYTSTGIYTKVGRTVSLTGQFTIVTAGTASGYAQIAGFPFTSNVNAESMGVARESSAGNIYYSLMGGNAADGYVLGSSNAAIAWTPTVTYRFSLSYNT